MNVFKRLRDIISSNVNSALDKMENPEKMIDLSITELEDSILEMKTILAEKKAEANGLERALEETKKSISRWEERARLALGKSEEEMAKEAVSEKLRASDKASRLEESLNELRAILASLEESKIDAEKKLVEMKGKALTMKARARSAREKKKVSEITSLSENSKFEKRLAEISAKIDKWEALATSDPIHMEAKESKSYEELEKEDAIEKELQRLKESIK